MSGWLRELIYRDSVSAPESGSAPTPRLELDVGERLISVDLQEQSPTAVSLVMGDDDLDLPPHRRLLRQSTDGAA
jgi:hypothetical protein